MMYFEISVVIFILLIIHAVHASNYNKEEGFVIGEDSADEVEDSDILVPCMKIHWNYELMDVEYYVFETHVVDSYKLSLITSNLMFGCDCLASNLYSTFFDNKNIIIFGGITLGFLRL